jgi:hypothetical protein
MFVKQIQKTNVYVLYMYMFSFAMSCLYISNNAQLKQNIFSIFLSY